MSIATWRSRGSPTPPGPGRRSPEGLHRARRGPDRLAAIGLRVVRPEPDGQDPLPGRLGRVVRARRLLERSIEYIAHPSFDDPGAVETILGPLPDGPTATRRAKVLEGPYPYLTGLDYASPLLSREQEVHLFRKFNYLKHRARRLCERLDPASAREDELAEIERRLAEAVAVRNQIVRANLRLVVAIAKKRLGPGDDFAELISDGNVALIRAVEKFDFARGHKFSTYATWAIRNQLRRSNVGKDRHHSALVLGRDEIFEADDPEPSKIQEEREATVARMLDWLGDRERRIIISRYGIGGVPLRTLEQLGKELGVTKERVRQIESRAHDKLCRLARRDQLDATLA